MIILKNHDDLPRKTWLLWSKALLRTEADTPTLSPSMPHANASLWPLPYILPISPDSSLAKEHSSILQNPLPLEVFGSQWRWRRNLTVRWYFLREVSRWEGRYGGAFFQTWVCGAITILPYELPSHHSHLQGAHRSVSECYPHSSQECVGQDRYSTDPVMKNYILSLKAA